MSLLPGKYYHIYNRGNNRENIFVEERNYVHFLQLLAKYILPIADVFAYCLLRNHFHFLIRIKEAPDANHKSPHQAFSNFFNAYARAFNRAYGRTGALFERTYKRLEITSDAHLLQLVAYIHHNPQKHGFVDDFREWPYSSFHALSSDSSTFIQRSEVLGWFEGRDHFLEFHHREEALDNLKPLSFDDFE
jgi:putative transposase